MSPRVPRLLLLSVALVLSSCSKKESVSEQPVRPVKAIQIGSPSTIDRKVITGKARPAEQVDIAFEVPGKLVELAVDVGDEVKKGQALAQLDPRDFRNAVAMAEAEAQRAAAQRDRVVKAFETNAVSAQDVTNAKAQSRAADAAVEIARKQLEETTIRAPYDGSIAATYVENFENVLGKQKVVRLIDLSRIEMVVDVPESLIPNVPYVESIEVVFAPFPEIKIPARVKEVGSEAS
ncbi:MAG: efflux RND transporter periplasmic adaptor subunit, partial [Haloferula sp.]